VRGCKNARGYQELNQDMPSLKKGGLGKSPIFPERKYRPLLTHRNQKVESEQKFVAELTGI
jgi:hypothetical protein